MKMKLNEIIGALILVFIVTSCSISEYDQSEVEEYIYVNQQALSLFKGEQIQLTASPTGMTYNWRSEDPTIASVSSTGLVEAVGVGSIYIFVYRDDTETGIPVTVIEEVPLTDIVLNVEDEIEMVIDTEMTVTAIPYPSDANNYKRFSWSSDNEDVVVVDQFGKISAVGLGTATVIIQSDDIVKQIAINVVVYTPPVNIVYDSSESNPVFGASNNPYLRMITVQLEPNTTYIIESTLPANNGNAAIFATDDTGTPTKLKILPNTSFEITTGSGGYVYFYARPPVDIDGASYAFNYTQIEDGTYKVTIRTSE